MGFLNMDSKHVQFLALAELESIFSNSGFRIAEQQARTVLCGPYIDQLLKRMPFQQALYRFNNRMADVLPMTLAAEWMFLLSLERKG